MKNNTEEIEKALSFDPLHEAEKLTGKSYKEDEGTSALGLLVHIAHNKKKQELLEFAGDTYFSIPVTEVLSKLTRHGFVKVLDEGFVGHPGAVDERKERCYLFWEPTRGILAWMETYGGYPTQTSTQYPTSCNMITFYFNWRPHNMDDFFPPHSSGGMARCEADALPYNEDGIHTFVGSRDGREGMFNAIDWLDEHGTFVTPWVERPHLWLLTYAEKIPPAIEAAAKKDWKISSSWYDGVTNGRLAKLPPEVLAKLASPRP